MTRNNYFATVTAGLETLLIQELEEKIQAIKILEIARGKVFFQLSKDESRLNSIKIAENIYQILSTFQLGPHRNQLSLVVEKFFQLRLKKIVDENKTYFVNASRRGRHNYNRHELSEKPMEGIKKRYPRYKQGTATNHDIEFRLDVSDELAIFSLRLTVASFRFHSANKVFSPAALKPTVAQAMVRLSKPNGNDIFIDPCCGSGTILIERLSFPFTYIGGGDHNFEVVEKARMNCFQSPIEVHNWDARHLDFDDHTISKVVTNLPFGKQISYGDETNQMNEDILIEINRILSKNGVVVILSEGWSDIQATAKKIGLCLITMYPIALKGLHPTIYIFTR